MEQKIIDLYNSLKTYPHRIERLDRICGVKYQGKEIKFRRSNVDLAIEYLKYKQDYCRKVNGVENHAKIRYFKTLNKELSYILNILKWFDQWELRDLTQENLEQVYDDMENDVITTIQGRKMSEGTKKDYYSKFFKHGFFQYFDKDVIAKKVILRKFMDIEQVRFFELDDLKKMVDNTRELKHRLMLWLMFDTGIEINAILQLTKSNFRPPEGERTYYLIHIGREIAKKKRAVRDLFINFDETNHLLAEYLPKLKDDERLFPFSYRNAHKVVHEVQERAKVRTRPDNKPVSIKDFRSSMATYFLTQDWTSDEIKSRLGHAISSRVIDRYVSYLGIGQERLKKKTKIFDMEKYRQQYQETQELLRKQTEKYQETHELLSKQTEKVSKMESYLKALVKQMMGKNLTPEEDITIDNFAEDGAFHPA